MNDLDQKLTDVLTKYKLIPSNRDLEIMREIWHMGRRSNVKRRQLVGLTGRAGSGKDSAADALCNYPSDWYNKPPPAPVWDPSLPPPAPRLPPALYQRMSFAGPLKTMLIAAGILTKAETEQRDLKEKTIDWCGKSPRHLMQTLGTEWGRQCIDPNFWIMLAQKQLDAVPAYTGVVFTDVRFENEATFIRDNGGIVIHIERACTQDVAAHTSEAGVERKYDEGDQLITNDGTLHQLHQHIRIIADKWYKS